MSGGIEELSGVIGGSALGIEAGGAAGAGLTKS
jgi:hypothetical protein